MKDVRLSVHVAVKTLNLEISRCLADYDKEFYLGASRTCSTPVYFVICPIRSFFYVVVVAAAKEYEKPSVPRILPRAKQGVSRRRFREQCSRSGESTDLPPMWPGFDSRIRSHTWVECFGSLRCSKRFFPGVLRFSRLTKNQHSSWFDFLSP